MKKIIAVVFALACQTSLLAQQKSELVFVCKNPDGTFEKLICTGDVGTDDCELYYASTTHLERIKLIVIQFSDDPLPMPHLVRFPNDTKNYRLDWNDETITCTSPNGKKQLFHAITSHKTSTFVCKNPDGTTEELYYVCDGLKGYYPCEIMYSSSKKKSPIALTQIRLNQADGRPEVVRFSGSDKEYTLEWLEKSIRCTNPDGTQQVFLYESTFHD